MRTFSASFDACWARISSFAQRACSTQLIRLLIGPRSMFPSSASPAPNFLRRTMCFNPDHLHIYASQLDHWCCSRPPSTERRDFPSNKFSDPVPKLNPEITVLVSGTNATHLDHVSFDRLWSLSLEAAQGHVQGSHLCNFCRSLHVQCRTIGALDAVQVDGDRYQRRCLGLQSSARRSLTFSLVLPEVSHEAVFKDTLFKLKKRVKRWVRSWHKYDWTSKSTGGAAPPTDPTPLPWSTLDPGSARCLRTAFGVCERAAIRKS